MATIISDFDLVSMVTTMFKPPPCIDTLSYVALILQLNSALKKLSFTVYRIKKRHNRPFSPFLKRTTLVIYALNTSAAIH